MSILLVSLVVFGLMLYFISVFGDMEKGRRITETMRKYVLVMESNGCLTETEQQALVLELQEIGVKDIVFNEDPLRQVSYGGEVVLSITGTVDALQITGYQDFKLVHTGDGIRFTKTIKSTAQH